MAVVEHEHSISMIGTLLMHKWAKTISFRWNACVYERPGHNKKRLCLLYGAIAGCWIVKCVRYHPRMARASRETQKKTKHATMQFDKRTNERENCMHKENAHSIAKRPFNIAPAKIHRTIWIFWIVFSRVTAWPTLRVQNSLQNNDSVESATLRAPCSLSCGSLHFFCPGSCLVFFITNKVARTEDCYCSIEKLFISAGLSLVQANGVK